MVHSLRQLQKRFQAPEKPFTNDDFSWDGGFDLLDWEFAASHYGIGKTWLNLCWTFKTTA
jgi:hypothetical protein